MNVINAANVVENNGKTFKENNLVKQHSIAIGTLVEVNVDYIEEHGIRLFVCSHDRDCDGTPLYTLSFDKEAGKKLEEVEEDLKNLSRNTNEYALTHWALTTLKGCMTGGFSEESLIVIK